MNAEHINLENLLRERRHAIIRGAPDEILRNYDEALRRYIAEKVEEISMLQRREDFFISALKRALDELLMVSPK